VLRGFITFVVVYVLLMLVFGLFGTFGPFELLLAVAGMITWTVVRRRRSSPT
jgi:hypothetical protein